MNISYYFKNLTDAEKDAVSSHFEGKKLPRLQKLLQRIPQEDRSLDVTVEKSVTSHRFIITFRLHVPKDEVYISDEHHELQEAIDLSFDIFLNKVRNIHDIKTDH